MVFVPFPLHYNECFSVHQFGKGDILLFSIPDRFCRGKFPATPLQFQTGHVPAIIKGGSNHETEKKNLRKWVGGKYPNNADYLTIITLFRLTI